MGRQRVIHCKNCRFFLKKKVKKRNPISTPMDKLIETGNEIVYDGVCCFNKGCMYGKGVNENNKCSGWEYNSKEKRVVYKVNNNTFTNYKCDGQYRFLGEKE